MSKKYLVEADWQFTVLAAMYGINFAQYNAKKEETMACIKTKVGNSTQDKTVIKKAYTKQEKICIDSLQEKRVVIIFTTHIS